MTTKKDVSTQKPRKKLSIRKETIRDLATKQDKADVIRGGKPTTPQTCECR
jgi:hypothetical protein